MALMSDLKGRVAVVTGAASGIGRGLARALVAEGANVVVADLDGAGAESVAVELRNRGGAVLAAACDVTDRAQIEALADAAWSEFGRVDIVANNAGIPAPRTRCIEIDEIDARRVMDVNFFGVWHGCAVFGQRFVEQGTPAWILNTASENSLAAPVLGMAMYTASKHAVLGLSDVLRQELPDHIGVSVLCPGIVATGMARMPRDGDAPEFGLDADPVARHAIDAMKSGAFYIVTHPPVREFFDERVEEIHGAFEAQAPRFSGDAYLDTRYAIRTLTERARRDR